MTSAISGLTAALLVLAMMQGGAFYQKSVLQLKHQLLGRWEWQRTATADAHVRTPASTGHRVILEFDRSGRARFYEDDTFVSATAFSVRHELAGFKWPGRQVLVYRGHPGSQLYLVSGNTLQLKDATGKLLEHRFTRVRE